MHSTAWTRQLKSILKAWNEPYRRKPGRYRHVKSCESLRREQPDDLIPRGGVGEVGRPGGGGGVAVPQGETRRLTRARGRPTHRPARTRALQRIGPLRGKAGRGWEANL